MGSEHSRTLAPKDYSFKRVVKDPEYGHVKIYEKRDEQIAMVIIQLKDDEMEKIREQVKQATPHENIINVYGCDVSQHSDLCSTIKILQISVEYLEQNLQWDISHRKVRRINFNEAEIWYIAQTLSQFGQYIDLHPCNVRLKAGVIKLLDLQFLPNNISNIHKVQQNMRNFEYLSPEQLLTILNAKQSTDVDNSLEKTNAFILGVILLVCLSGADVELFYDVESIKFNFELALSKLSATFLQRGNLSIRLKQFIEDLLTEDSHDRPSITDVYEHLESMDRTKFAPHLNAEKMHISNQQSMVLQQSQIKSKSQSLLEPDVNYKTKQLILEHDQAQFPIFPTEKEQIYSPIQKENQVIEISPQRVNQEVQVQMSKVNEEHLSQLSKLKQKLEILRGERNAVTEEPPTSKDSVRQQVVIGNTLIRNVDPEIQRVLNKSRDILSKCHYTNQSMANLPNKYIPQQQSPQQVIQPQLPPNYPPPSQRISSNFASQQLQQIPMNPIQQVPVQKTSMHSQSQFSLPLQFVQTSFAQQQGSFAQVQQNSFVNQQGPNIQELISRAQREIEKSNQISQQYFTSR